VTLGLTITQPGSDNAEGRPKIPSYRTNGPRFQIKGAKLFQNGSKNDSWRYARLYNLSDTFG
jgi:hypothetical protein